VHSCLFLLTAIVEIKHRPRGNTWFVVCFPEGLTSVPGWNPPRRPKRSSPSCWDSPTS